MQKEEDDAHDQQDRNKDSSDDLVDGFADEYGRIVDDFKGDPGRKLFGERLHARQDFVLHGQRIGAGLGEDEERHARPAVHESRRAIVRRTNFGTPDVTETSHATLRVGFQHDGGELLGRSQPPQRLHVELISLIRGDRRLIEEARRDLNVLRPQGCKDFAGIQVMSSNLIRVEPDAHRVFACPLELDIADARQSRKYVFYMQRRVVR